MLTLLSVYTYVSQCLYLCFSVFVAGSNISQYLCSNFFVYALMSECIWKNFSVLIILTFLSIFAYISESLSVVVLSHSLHSC